VKNTRGTRQPMQTDLCHYYCSTIFRFFFFILLLMAVIIKNVFCGCGYFLNIFLLKYILIIFFYFLKIIFNNNILK